MLHVIDLGVQRMYPEIRSLSTDTDPLTHDN